GPRYDADLGLGAGINGWTLAAQVKERWPAVAFVLVTGWGASIDLLRPARPTSIWSLPSPTALPRCARRCPRSEASAKRCEMSIRRLPVAGYGWNSDTSQMDPVLTTRRTTILLVDDLPGVRR